MPNLQSEIGKKLEELGSEFAADSGTLVDFIQLMVSNAKSQETMAAELGESTSALQGAR